jgi:uncharacterized ion transporter superfamily protein YfcC
MGALTGAGMFVGCVVAGRIVTLSGGVRARGAQVRDIATQFITVAVVTGIGKGCTGLCVEKICAREPRSCVSGASRLLPVCLVPCVAPA